MVGRRVSQMVGPSSTRSKGLQVKGKQAVCSDGEMPGEAPSSLPGVNIPATCLTGQAPMVLWALPLGAHGVGLGQNSMSVYVFHRAGTEYKLILFLRKRARERLGVHPKCPKETLL